MVWKTWENDEAAICAEIRASRRPFKIVLKTKNELMLLPDWIKHHVRIVGTEGVVIFDNGSTDDEVLGYLDEIGKYISVYQFRLMHNYIHNSSNRFKALYAALRASCEYYMFLDTDERLIWATKDGYYYDDSRVVDHILTSRQPAIPGIWAQNKRAEAATWVLTFRKNRILKGIRSGKPVLSSRLDVHGPVNHNSQVPYDAFEAAAIGNVIIGHLRNYSAEQRIAANLEKISSYNRERGIFKQFGITSEVITLADLSRVDRSLLKGNAGSYVDEIRALIKRDEDGGADPLTRAPGVTFEDGRMIFVNAQERQEILQFMADPAATLKEGLLTPR